MPTAETLLWRHVILHTKNSWLHGDERGFRDRHHRIHSTGDSKNTPPKIEHEGLRRWSQNRAGDPVLLSKDLRPLIVKAFVDRLMKESFEVLTLTCSETHIHCLSKLPSDLPTTKDLVGRCKRNACGAVHHILPGPLWSAGGSYKPIRNYDHHKNAYDYITTDQEPGTFVWTYKAEEYWME